MPIRLLEPFDPGDLDPGNSYEEVRLRNINIDLVSNIVSFSYTYGNTISGVWQRGLAAQSFGHRISGEDYNDVKEAKTLEEEDHSIYEGIKRILYRRLLDLDIIEGDII